MSGHCVVCAQVFLPKGKNKKCCNSACSLEYKKHFTKYLTDEEKQQRAKKELIAYHEKKKVSCKKELRHKYSLEEVGAYFLSEGYLLLSTSFRSTKEKLEVRCPNHHVFYPTFHNFKNGGTRCGFCKSTTRVTLLIVEKGTFEKECSFCEEKFITVYSHKIICGAPTCLQKHRAYINKTAEDKRLGRRFEDKQVYYTKNKEGILAEAKQRYREKYSDRVVMDGPTTVKLTLEEVTDYVVSQGYSLLSKEYVNSAHKLLLRCPKDHVFEMAFHNFKHGAQRCPTCMSHFQESRGEKELYSYFSTNFPDLKIQSRSRVFSDNRQEVDILFKDNNLAVEYCGLRWHGEAILSKRTNPRKYHRNKMELCNKEGLRLITVFEDEYLERPDVVISIIQHSLGRSSRVIYARKCIVRQVGQEEAAVFLTQNHLQGSCPSTFRWGLFYEDELVSVMTVGATSRYSASDGGKILELKRYACKSFTQVVGGASKLFKQVRTFAQNTGFTSIKSYADLRYADPGRPVYQTLGFSLIRESLYSPHYVRGRKRYRNQTLRKTSEERLTGKTEWELRSEQGYDRIWDCGHRTYLFTL